uniref:F-box domain-containing protein n=1 Tax=Triticum urartu TaxID=4572 RepID=A0A8R7URJ1_TRIUA
MSSRRRHALSPAAAPLDDDDLLSKILLRLRPQPSSLPRASLVCRRWHLLDSDPRFARRFRLHHRRNPPLLGFFDEGPEEISFVPTLEPPNRVPPGRFSLKFDGGDRYVLLGCRHGLVLVYHPSWKQILVWDPVTADQHRIAVPPGFARDYGFIRIPAAVLRASGDVHFQVALTVIDREHRRALACVYSSET